MLARHETKAARQGIFKTAQRRWQQKLQQCSSSSAGLLPAAVSMRARTQPQPPVSCFPPTGKFGRGESLLVQNSGRTVVSNLSVDWTETTRHRIFPLLVQVFRFFCVTVTSRRRFSHVSCIIQFTLIRLRRRVQCTYIQCTY